MYCNWIDNDLQPLDKYIHWGNTLKLGFTEKEFLNYRSTVMGWLSKYWEKKGISDLAAQYFAKNVDIINTDGKLVLVEDGTNKSERQLLRKSQLAAILSILNEYKSNRTIRWANIKSWISIGIAITSLLVSICF